MTTLTEAANLTPTYEQLRKFAVSIVREKLLHGSNPTLLTLAAKLEIAEVAEILEGRAVEEMTSPLTEARAEVRKLRLDFAKDQAELASQRIRIEEQKKDLEQAGKVITELALELETMKDGAEKAFDLFVAAYEELKRERDELRFKLGGGHG